MLCRLQEFRTLNPGAPAMRLVAEGEAPFLGVRLRSSRRVPLKEASKPRASGTGFSALDAPTRAKFDLPKRVPVAVVKRMKVPTAL